MTSAAAFAAWLGAAVIVLSYGRRGLALGLALTTIGFTVLAAIGGGATAAVAVLLGGAVAALQRSRTGGDVWGVMPPGSTPQLVLSIGGGLMALYIATSLTTGPGAPLRFAALAVIGLMGVRILTEREPAVMLTPLAALALAVAMATGIAGTGPGPSPYIAAALIAIGVSVIRLPESNGA